LDHIYRKFDTSEHIQKRWIFLRSVIIDNSGACVDDSWNDIDIDDAMALEIGQPGGNTVYP